jgi:hypothetical protein
MSLNEQDDESFDADSTDEETALTEISFLPDGRICLFGASREIVNLLLEINLGDQSLLARHLSMTSAAPTPPLTNQCKPT